MTEGRRDLAASLRQRLLNVSRARGDDPNLTLTRYAVERLLYRLSVSAMPGSLCSKARCCSPSGSTSSTARRAILI